MKGRLSAALCAAGALLLFFLPFSNPDVFWHLSAGRWMAEHLAIPRQDWLSHTLAGAPWADFEWLPQLLYYGIYSAFGLKGLWLLKAAVLSGCAAVLWKTAGPTAALLWAASLAHANDLRPENFSLLFLLGLSKRLEEDRVGPWLYALFALWANVHPGFVYVLALLAVHRWRRPAPVLLAGLATLLNPYGAGLYAVLWRHAADAPLLRAYIREWQAPGLSLSLWPFWIVLAGTAALAAARRLRARDSVSAALFGALAAAHVRMTPYFLCLAVPMLLRVRMRWIPAAALAIALPAAASQLPGFRRFSCADMSQLPVGMTDFIRGEAAELRGLRLFNPWGWGGYLGFRLFPDLRVSVDGRYIFHGLLKPMYEATASPEDYRSFLDGHGMQLAAVEHVRQFVRTETGAVLPFYETYFPRGTWALLYRDDQALLFARRDALPERYLRERDLRPTSSLPASSPGPACAAR